MNDSNRFPAAVLSMRNFPVSSTSRHKKFTSHYTRKSEKWQNLLTWLCIMDGYILECFYVLASNSSSILYTSHCWPNCLLITQIESAMVKNQVFRMIANTVTNYSFLNLRFMSYVLAKVKCNTVIFCYSQLRVHVEVADTLVQYFKCLLTWGFQQILNVQILCL